MATANIAELRQQTPPARQLADMKPREQIAYLLDQKKGELAKMLPKTLSIDRLLKVAQEGIDMVAISFVRSAHDVRRVGVEHHAGPVEEARGLQALLEIQQPLVGDRRAGLAYGYAGFGNRAGDRDADRRDRRARAGSGGVVLFP